MCVNRDLGIKWPQWHTLMFDRQIRVDMRYVCPKRHREHDLLSRRTKEEWTDDHRHVARKLGCRSDSSTLVGQMTVSAKHVTKRKAQNSTGSTIAQNGTKSDVRSQRLSESGSKKREPQREWKWQRGIATHPRIESKWISMKKWESDKHRRWGMPATAPCWAALESVACGWAVVQLDYDEDLGPLHGMCGSMEAELQVQRTIKRAELAAFLCILKNQGACRQQRILTGYGEERENASIRKLAMSLTCGSKFWGGLHLRMSKEILVEVELNSNLSVGAIPTANSKDHQSIQRHSPSVVFSSTSVRPTWWIIGAFYCIRANLHASTFGLSSTASALNDLL